MTVRFPAGRLLLLLAVVSSFACEKEKSANPLSPDVAGPIPGVAISAPRPLEPAVGAELVADGQPQTLIVENGSSTGERPLFLQLQVASDANFERLVHHNERLTPGTNGRTSYR